MTFYAETLAVKNFDNRVNYVSVQVQSGIWYVCDNPNLESTASESPIPRFKRLRTVKLVNQFMTCSCGYPQRVGSPCRHILCILDYDCPSLHHPRWWRDYNYHYGRCPRFTSHFDKVLSKLNNNSGIYIDRPKLLISEQLPLYGLNFTDDLMVYVKWLLGYYKSTTPIVANTVVFDPNDADSEGEFEPESDFCLDLNLSQLSQCEQIFKSATANKFLDMVQNTEVEPYEFKTEKMFYSEGVAKWKEITKLATGNNEAHQYCIESLSSMEHHVRDLLLKNSTVTPTAVLGDKRVLSEYESCCIESEKKITAQRFKNAYEM